MTGGMVSFGPPLGAFVVLAHECENIMPERISITGIPGSRYENLFFINKILFFNFQTDDTLYAFNLHQPVRNRVKVIPVANKKIYVPVKDTGFASYT